MPAPAAPPSSAPGHHGAGLKGALANLGPHAKPVAVVGAGALGGLVLLRMKKGGSSAAGAAAGTTAAGTAANVAGGDPYGLANDVTNSLTPEIESLQQQITRLQNTASTPGATGPPGIQGPPGADSPPLATGTPILAPGSGTSVPTPTPALPSIAAQFITAVTAGAIKPETGALLNVTHPQAVAGGTWAALGPPVSAAFAGNSGSVIPSWLRPS